MLLDMVQISSFRTSAASSVPSTLLDLEFLVSSDDQEPFERKNLPPGIRPTFGLPGVF